MAVRVGFRQAAALRDGVRAPSRYVPLRSLHPAALWLAAGSPLLAALLLLGLRIGG